MRDKNMNVRFYSDAHQNDKEKKSVICSIRPKSLQLQLQLQLPLVELHPVGQRSLIRESFVRWYPPFGFATNFDVEAHP
jgi:hypothetical protein